MKNSFTHLKKRVRERKGVALILVMGLLSLMLVMGISFASLARTERKASANYVEGVKAKGLMYAAVHEALNNLEQNATSYETVSGIKIYPANKVMRSRAGTTVTSEYLIDEFIPSDTVAEAVFGKDLEAAVSAEINNMTWNDIGGGKGEYCFIASNLSGLPDVNASFLNNPAVAAQPVSFPREDGITALEVKHDNDFLTPATGMADMHFLISDNGTTNPVFRFESVAALDYLTEDLFAAPNASSTFTFFSRYPLTSYVGGSINSLLDITSISSVGPTQFDPFFLDAGILGSPMETSFIVAYNDYVDADEIPSTFTDVGIERAPHISEVRAKIDVSVAGTDMTVTVTIDHEAAYLNSVLPTVNSFNLNAAYTIDITYDSGAGSTTLTIPEVAQPFAATTLLTGGGYIAVGPNAYTVTSAPLPFSTSGTIDSVDVKVTKLEIQGSAKVDEIAPASSIISLSSVSLGTGTHYVSNEAADPRFNWDLSGAGAQWVLGSVGTVATVATIGSPNVATAAILFPTDPLGDADLLTYSANDNLFTVGELGFIPYDIGRSVPLFTRGARTAMPVYNYFTHFPATHNEALNPNSEYINAMANMFYNMPLNDFPGQTAPQTVTAVNATDLATEIYNGRFYLNAGDIADTVTTLFDDSVVTVSNSGSMGSVSENKRESLVRNSFGLLGTQNNFINMLLLVRAKKNGNTTAANKALVTVWRHGYPDSDGDHSMYIRSIRHLEE